MNVLQFPKEISGQTWNYAKAIRQTGHRSTAAVFEPHLYGYEYDELIYPNGFPGKWWSRFYRVRYFIKTIKRFDILNYWASSTLLNDIDLRMASSIGIPTVMTFCGSSIRSVSEAAKKSEFLDADGWPREPRNKEYFAQLNEYLDLAIYQYYELEPYVREHFDHAVHIPRAVDCEKISPQQPRADTDDILRVAHAPSDRQLKGTKHVIDAVQSLKNNGYNIEITVIEGTHTEVIETLQQADLVVDRLKLGTFGVVSLEAMATGTPTVCYMRDDLRSKYPDELPVINATPETIEQVLAELATDADRRRVLGSQGREYVTRYHDLSTIGDRLLNVYEQLL
jgi:glycosyltransferase involved in cell wall biosynthesis